MSREHHFEIVLHSTVAALRLLDEVGVKIHAGRLADDIEDAIREQVDTPHAPGCCRDEQGGVCYCATQRVVA